MNRLFSELSESKEEGDVLRTVYRIIEKVKGRKIAVAFGVLCHYPLHDQTLVSEIFTEDGGLVVVSKERRRMVQWPQFTREQADRFDNILATRQQNNRLSVIATPAPIMGQDLRTYEVLPQLVSGDFDTWLLMQELFSYQSSAPLTAECETKIKRYIQEATGSAQCLSSANMIDNIRSFSDWFRRGDKKRKRPVPLTTDQWELKNQIIKRLSLNQYTECFQLLSQYCQQSNAPRRVLQALQRHNSQVIADGCLFTIQFEPFVLCKYKVAKKKIFIGGPWVVIVLRDGTANRVTEEGVSITGDALFMALGPPQVPQVPPQVPQVPQVQVWVNRQFISPFLFWKFWRSASTKSIENNSIAHTLAAFAKQVFAPVPTLTEPVGFLQMLWQNANDCMSTTAVSS